MRFYTILEIRLPFRDMTIRYTQNIKVIVSELLSDSFSEILNRVKIIKHVHVLKDLSK